MKELKRFAGYTSATLAVILILIWVAKTEGTGPTLLYSSFFLVVVLPLVGGLLMVRREKRNAE